MSPRLHFSESLAHLAEGVLELGSTVRTALERALRALRERDTALAEEILRRDPEVDRLQVEMEDRCVALIATEQPVAGDLRWLAASMRIASNLERIGDHAVHMAEVARRHAGETYLAVIGDLEGMARSGIAMLGEAMNAYRTRDPELARRIASRDDELDRVHDSLVKRLLEQMQENPDSIPQALSLLTLTRFLERLGDHVVSICEWIVYAAEGEHLRLK